MTNNAKVQWWIGGILAFVGFIAQQALFDIATWLLAYNYFICAQKLKKINKHQTADDKQEEQRQD